MYDLYLREFIRTLFISDLHLFHNNCLGFDNRPFIDMEEMIEEIVRRWNAKVQDEDNVFVLGDVAYKKAKDVHLVLERLKGHKHLIIGNHDPVCVMKNERAMACFESVESYARIRVNGVDVILSHYPIISWEMKKWHSVHVYGHVHTRVNEDTIYMLKQENAYNCGCMLNNYEPCTIEELAENKRKRNEMLGIL